MNRYLVPVFAVLLAALALLSLRGGQPSRGAAAEQAQAPRYTLRGVEWERFDAKGQREFEGRAETIDYYDDESARMTQFEITLLKARGAPWSARAPQGSVPPGDRRVQLLGGVVGEGRWPDGEPLSFETPELWVDSAQERLDTNAQVQLHSRTREAQSRGLKVDGTHQQLVLLNDVKMRYAPK